MSSLKGLTFPLEVSERIQETDDAVSLVFKIPEDLKSKFQYQPGQFITFDLDINNENLHRSYSLASSPTYDDNFKVSIKRVEGGRASNYLIDSVKVGDTLASTPPAGRFFKPSMDATHYLLFAAGSGITPIISILKSVLDQDAGHKVSLLYSSRSDEHIIFAEELNKLQKTFADTLKVQHLISKPSESCSYATGRLNKDICQQLVSEVSKSQKLAAYMCGPDGFMETVEQSLEALGVAKDCVHKESFTPVVANAEASDVDGTLIGPGGTAAPTQTMNVIVNGETQEVSYNSGASALECFIEAGLNIPYSCMDGACMACLAKVTEGQVVQSDLCILTDENVRDGETLTCQCKPVTESVTFDFDDI